MGMVLVLPLRTDSADTDEVAQMMRAFEDLKAHNEAMAARLQALEAERGRAVAAPPAAEQERLARRVAQLESASAAQGRLVRDMLSEKSALEERLRELESANAAQREEAVAMRREKEGLEQRILELEATGGAGTDGPGTARSQEVAVSTPRYEIGVPGGPLRGERMVVDVETDMERARLEQRIRELESAQLAQEDATRAIIRDAMTSVGPNINESVALGGALEVVAGWSEEFDGSSAGDLLLNTAELDLEVMVNDWTLAGMVIEYDDGTDVSFVSTGGFEESVDRVNLDTAFITLGDPQRFPPFLTAGQIILPFGISTGDPVADVLTIEDPLTISGFEQRQVAVGVGAAFPTPPQTPALPITPPPIRPQVVRPAWDKLLSAIGVKPPAAYPLPPTPIVPPPEPPKFNFGIFSFNGDTFDKSHSGWRPDDYLDLTVGYRTGGHCGKPYDELERSHFCPWTLDLDIDYNSSVFDSRFLRDGYRKWLGDIGFIPGVAASLKSTLGPLSVVGEWNGAVRTATFVDDADNRVAIRPSAWQVSLGYQLDWNPWMEAVGEQGTYLAIGYSESSDFGGVQREIDGELSRVGFLPRRRLLIGAGEWFMDGVKLAIEYSRDWDYSTRDGGTGRSADGVFSSLTYVW